MGRITQDGFWLKRVTFSFIEREKIADELTNELMDELTDGQKADL
jgi:hypothetical protein